MPTLSFSFDNGKIDPQGGYALDKWNEMILNTLKKHAIKSVLFSSGANKTGHVSIDASDWYVDGRLIKRLTENQNADISGFKAFYISHLYDRAMYYESL